MRRSGISVLIFAQVLLCWLETYLISRISLIGKIGIALVHREYRIFRSGWKTFILFFGIQLAVIAVLYLVRNRYSRKVLEYSLSAFLLIAVIGLLTTYFDFQDTYSHRLLKERFHLGFYLFWLGWMGSCAFFLLAPAPVPHRYSEKNASTPDSIGAQGKKSQTP